MELSEQELRALVREAVARYAAGSGRGGDPPAEPGAPLDAAGCREHASHLRLPVHRGGEDGGVCLIEPAARCTHCGFCQSFGH
ncbi:MAG: hypothetical protein IT176_07635 [Acidobacteria bacterium]|nr:hypothetical protein [Acidobacteriota bacterium]